jgi:hypothetical protein
MDHLPLPSNPAVPKIDIPFVSELSYEFGRDNYDLFPIAHLPALETINPRPTQHQALLSLAQTWLYFGTLAEFFQEEVRPDDFKEYSLHGSRNLTSRNLKVLKGRWIEAQQLTSPRARSPTVLRCHALLEKALFICEKLGDVYKDTTMHIVLLSIRVLLGSLLITAKSISGFELERSNLSNLLSRIKFRSVKDTKRNTDMPILMSHMLDNGWW